MISMPSSQHLATVCGEAWLIEMRFTSGTVRCTTAPLTVTSGGFSWTGLGQCLEVRDVSESADVGTEKLTLALSVVDTALLSLTLGSVEGYRGRGVRLYLQLFDETWQPAGSPVLRWAGLMNRVAVDRQSAPEGGGEATGTINMQCSRSGAVRSRNHQGRRLTDAQHRAAYPGDTGLRFVRPLIEQPALWLSKRFQEQH